MSPLLTTTSLPRIGDPAPDFEAQSTHGPLRFSAWRGESWAILFSHPADFTPVCSTEMAEFACRYAEFQQRGVKLIGLSVDSIHSHLAWRENLKTVLGVDIAFPIISDLSTDVARLYGMLHERQTAVSTVRALFVIDPKGIVRALVYYPLNVGRNVDEVVRLIDALQTADQHGCALPVNWKPGDSVIVPPPRTVDEVNERMQRKDTERIDFYLSKKQL